MVIPNPLPAPLSFWRGVGGEAKTKTMKQLTLIIILFIATQSFTQTGAATNPPLGADSASIYLTGTFKKYNPQKAFALYKQRADTGEAKAMNAVALMYTKGLGVDSSFGNAIYWYIKAAQNGYAKALVNIGMLYKHKATDSVGYAHACSYYSQAVQAQEQSAYFALGYMYYKGLGCTQSYTNALNLFKQGLTYNRPDCMYFIGLCYKFGYGVTANADSAERYLDKAALLGYTQANNYFANTTPTGIASRTTNRGVNSSSPLSNWRGSGGEAEKQEIRNDEFRYIPKSQTPIQIIGTYTGFLTQYDYSGKQIIAQIPLTIELFKQSNSIITGNFILDNNQAIKLQAIQQGNQLLFSQTALTQQQQTTRNKKRETKFLFKSATLQQISKADTSYLNGTINLFNSYTNETDKPISISLKQKTSNPKLQTNNNEKLETRNLAISPNPVTNEFTLSFNLPKPSACKFSIHNMQGQIMYTAFKEYGQKGSQQFKVQNLSLANGIYVVTMLSNGVKETQSFIKE